MAIEFQAHIARGDGAWLLSVVDIEGAGDIDEFHHAFGSLVKAKRFARTEYGVGKFQQVTPTLYRADKAVDDEDDNG